MTRLAAALACALPFVAAFQDTAPLLAWSSQRSQAIDTLPASAVQASTVLDALLSSDRICDYDAVVLVQQRGLHASDLRNERHLSDLLTQAPSSRSFQYLVTTDASASLPNRAHEIANECGSRLTQYAAGDPGVVLDHQRKHVVSLALPDVVESGTARRESVSESGRELLDELDALTTAFPYHLIIYSGVPLSTLNARASPLAHRAADDELPKGGILKRYQILTPGLISIFLVVLFVLIPVLMMGINALAGIQNPIKMDMPKNFNAQERKNQ